MRRVWVGYVQELGFAQFIARYIDPLFVGSASEELNSEFVHSFGAAEIGPGEYEVYERARYPSLAFDAVGFTRLSQLVSELNGLKQGVPNDATLIFYVSNTATPTRRSDGIVTITDVVDAAFEWETQQ